MRNEETLDKLKKMRLGGMAEAYENHSNDREIQNLSFEERFNLLIDYEYARRQSNKLQRLINQSTFIEPEACVEDIEYYPDRHLDKEFMTRLATGQYVEDGQNISPSATTKKHHYKFRLSLKVATNNDTKFYNGTN